MVAAAREGLKKPEIEVALPRVGEVPFDSGRKRMTTVHEVVSGSGSATLEALKSVLNAEQGVLPTSLSPRAPWTACWRSRAKFGAATGRSSL